MQMGPLEAWLALGRLLEHGQEYELPGNIAYQLVSDNGGAEYRVEKTDSGFAVSGPALGKPSFFKSEDKALSLARHIIGPKGGSIVRIAGNGKTTRQRVPAKLDYTPAGGNQRDAELEEYDGKFQLPVPDEAARQALLEFIQRRDQEVARRVTDAQLKAGYHR